MGWNTVAAVVAQSPALFHVVRSGLDPGQESRLKAFLAGVEHANLLEAGCGIGANHAITDRPYLGLDLDPRYITYAGRTYGSARVRFAVGDLLAPPDPAHGRFDLVALLNVVHHLDDAQVTTAVGRARDAGAKHVLVVDVALERTGFLFQGFFGPLDRGAHFRTTDDLRTLLTGAGLVIEREAHWTTGPGIWPRVAFIGRFG